MMFNFDNISILDHIIGSKIADWQVRNFPGGEVNIMIRVAVYVAVPVLVELDPDGIVLQYWVEGYHGVRGALCATLPPVPIVLSL